MFPILDLSEISGLEVEMGVIMKKKRQQWFTSSAALFFIQPVPSLCTQGHSELPPFPPLPALFLQAAHNKDCCNKKPVPLTVFCLGELKPDRNVITAK